MKKRLIISVLILLITSRALVQSYASTEDSLKSTQLSSYIDKYDVKNKFRGTVLVAKNGNILLNKGYGLADYSKKVANQSTTVFETASLTKQFTATAIMMLQESNLLNVKDTLNKYIPDYPNGSKITLNNLLTQTSGIVDYNPESLENNKSAFNPNEIIALFKNKPLEFKTGTEYKYSGSNYILLGYIIQKVSGMTYEEYIDKNIIKPLKLNSTGFLENKDVIKNKASGYHVDTKNGKLENVLDTESLFEYSAGGIYSTVGDLYTWQNALFGGKLISLSSVSKMMIPYFNTYGYGYGLIISKNADGDKLVGHDGSLPGYSTYIEKNMDKQSIIIILSNKDDYNVADMNLGLSKIVDAK